MSFRKVDVSASFVAFLCAYYYFDPMGSFVPFVCAAALHELGHCCALLLCGVKIQKICLRAFGTQIETESMSYGRELLCAMAGPAVNFGLLLLFTQKMPLFALVNLCLLGYNLLPIFPLDGGRMLRALLSMLLPLPAVILLERLIGGICLAALVCGCCYLTCVWHAGLWPTLVAAVLILRVADTILPENRKIQV